MDWTDFLLIFSNLSMLLAIRFSVKNKLFLEAWIFFQSMTISMTYHGLDQNPNTPRELWLAFKFIDFYAAILVMITLSVYTAKVKNEHKGIPHIILGTFSVFWLSYGKWDINKEIIIGSVCFGMTVIILVARKKKPKFKKKNLIKGIIFTIMGFGSFHIKYFKNNLPYWLSHTCWHIFIMLAAFYLMKIHPINEIKDLGRDAISRVQSVENLFTGSPNRVRLEELPEEN